jgi:hypothetical protein
VRYLSYENESGGLVEVHSRDFVAQASVGGEGREIANSARLFAELPQTAATPAAAPKPAASPAPARGTPEYDAAMIAVFEQQGTSARVLQKSNQFSTHTPQPLVGNFGPQSFRVDGASIRVEAKR